MSIFGAIEVTDLPSVRGQLTELLRVEVLINSHVETADDPRLFFLRLRHHARTPDCYHTEPSSCYFLYRSLHRRVQSFVFRLISRSSNRHHRRRRSSRLIHSISRANHSNASEPPHDIKRHNTILNHEYQCKASFVERFQKVRNRAVVIEGCRG